ncbi:MAG: tetratricopeptide repeat protein [Hyphomicrobiales bacterium]
MARRPLPGAYSRPALALLTSAAVLALLPACSLTGSKSKGPVAVTQYTEKPRVAAKPTNPLYVATAYWAEQHRKDPRDPKAAIAYAQNLKAMGSPQKAMEALAETYAFNPQHKELASEYGRTALGMGDAKLAEQLLEVAERPDGRTDWRVLSARGAILAKQGKHEAAQGYLVAALQQQPNEPAIMNNLALSYAMSGKPAQAEKLLRQAEATGGETARIRQNLTLVLGVQGKIDDARRIAEADLPKAQAAANVAFLRNMTKDSRFAPTPEPEPAAAPQVARAATVPQPAPVANAAKEKPVSVAKAGEPAPQPKPAGKAREPEAPAWSTSVLVHKTSLVKER